MTDTSTPTTFSPADDPVKVVGDRRITAKWNLGPVDEDGWQRQARLVVNHWKDTRRYTAALRVSREKVEKRGGVTIESELMTYDGVTSKLSILEQDASRFSCKTLDTVYDTALALLRSRFEDGEDAVTDYFDPTSNTHGA